MSNWLWKLVKIRSKNVNDVAEWILNKKDEIVNKVLPPSVVDLIEPSKKSKYNYERRYWKINLLSNPKDEEYVIQKVQADRLKYGRKMIVSI